MAHVEEIEEQLHRFGVTEEALEALLPDNDPNYRRFVSQSTIRTASSGVVTGHDVHEGEVIDPSSELLTVTDLSVVWVIADVSERDLSLVRSGQPVSVRVEAYPNELFRSDIACTSDIAERASRTARVRCVVRNPDGRLKIGMFATVDIPSGRTYEAVGVPTAAIQAVQGREVVCLQRTDTEFKQREVETGSESDGWTELADRIGTGEAVLATGSALAKSLATKSLGHGAH